MTEELHDNREVHYERLLEIINGKILAELKHHNRFNITSLELERRSIVEAWRKFK